MGRKGKKGKLGKKGRGGEEGNGEERERKKGNELDASPGGPGPSWCRVLVPQGRLGSSPGRPFPVPRTVRMPVLGNPDLAPQDWMP